MNKFIIALALSAGLLASTAQADHCFTPYDVRIVNQSGGPAELKSSKNISGIRREDEINNGTSQVVRVEDLGAQARFEFGPEKEEVTKSVPFYEKTGVVATVVLGSKGAISTSGFNTKAGEKYEVTIKNQSGGYVDVLQSCDVAFKGSIRDGETQVIKVRAGSELVLKMGPKKAKKVYKITFSTPSSTRQPVIVLQQPTFFHPAIQPENVNLRRGRVGNPKPRQLPSQRENKNPGCRASMRKADLHG